MVFLETLTLLLILIYCYYKWSFTYWKKRNIPGPKPSIPLGIPLGRFLLCNTGMHEFMKLFYDEMKALGHKHCGFYMMTRPVYMVIDPEFIKNIFIKDFNNFSDRGIYYNERDDPLSAHVVSLELEKWKRLRSKFTPTFTVGKMKMMFDSLVTCSNNMSAAIHSLSTKPVDIKEVCACFTTDVIGSCAFGLECNSFVGKESEFRRYGKRNFDTSLKRAFQVIFTSSCANLAKMLGLKMVYPDVAEFFMNVVKTTIKYREENGIVRNDFLQLLMEIRQADEAGLSIDEIVAQSYLFFTAGFETTSSTMSFCLFELSMHEDVQSKVRKEADKVLSKYGGKLTYDGIMEMKYTNQVVEETLRKYPPLPMLPRVCTKDYHVPEGNSYIKKGTQAFIPVYALHRDPDFYPDPDKFDPERFNVEGKATRRPFTYIPFGEGPRICLGEKFGILQVKIGLVSLLRRFKFTLNASTRNPLRYDSNAFLLTSKDPIWLNVLEI